MGKRGPKPEPTALKVLKGNPGKRPLNDSEPQPVGDAQCPDWISEDSRKYWEYIVSVLSSVPGLLTIADSASLALMADTLALYRRAQMEVEGGSITCMSEKGSEYQHPAVGIRNKAAAELKQWFAKFGMTPSDRAGLSIPGHEEGDDELGEMLA